MGDIPIVSIINIMKGETTMYQFNLKNLNIFTPGSKRDWVNEIVKIQEDVADMGLDRIGGFAVH